jgi:hypothetical protein
MRREGGLMATGDRRQKFSGTRDNNLDFPEQLRARRTLNTRVIRVTPVF